MILLPYYLSTLSASRKKLHVAKAKSCGAEIGAVGFLSGGFDPIHPGHVEYIREAEALCETLFIIVNGDHWVQRKKGYVFMPEDARAKMVDAVCRNQNTVVCVWDDGKNHVAEAIKRVSPDIVFNGGDRNNGNLSQEEIDVCKLFKIRHESGIGGTEKKYSSSELVENAFKRQYSNQRETSQ